MTTYQLTHPTAGRLEAPALDGFQRSVVDHPGGPLLVLAGPGTGKTTTLVEAIVDRIEHRGADPSSVLALTFSRKAAEQLRDRVTARLGRTMARLWKAVDDTLVAEGVRWSFSRINRFNTASVRSHQRLGARSIGSAVFLVLGPLQLALGGGKRLPSVSLGAGIGPQLRIHAPLPPAP